jgi:Flp pilus assembly protein TadG
MWSKSMSRSRRREPKGQVLVLFALFLVVLIGATAITVDFGSWLKVRRDYQNYADAASLAGSSFLSRPVDATKRAQARQAAWESLKTQLGLSAAIDPTDPALTDFDTGVAGLSDPGTGYRLWVSTPPKNAGAAYTGALTSPTSRTLFVQVSKDNPSFFSQIFGQGARAVTTYATAGSFANRYAVITLRQPGQDGPANATDIDFAGSNSGIEVIGGDVGGNWGMKLNSSSHLWIHGVADNEADTYLTNYITCGSSCWNVGQINSGPAGFPPSVNRDPLPLPAFVDDPSYPLPAAIASAPSGPLIPALPTGDIGGNVDVRSGGPNDAPGGATTIAGVLTCDPASPRIGPGFYSNIHVRGGKCLILDPTMRHSSITAATPDVPTPLLSGQIPGVFYVNGSIDVENDAMIVGDGVSIVIRPGVSNDLLAGAGGVVDLNTGKITPNRQRGGFTVQGTLTYSCDVAMTCTYNTALNSQLDQVGVALYVIKREQYSVVAVDDNSDVVKINSGAGLAWQGVTYAPHDNVILSGQPGHDGIGKLVSWTFKFAGGTNVRQTFDGLDQSLPRLIEPTLGQP